MRITSEKIATIKEVQMRIECGQQQGSERPTKQVRNKSLGKKISFSSSSLLLSRGRCLFGFMPLCEHIIQYSISIAQGYTRLLERFRVV